MNNFIIPIGPPGVGKTTFANYLVEHGFIAPTAIVSPDEYREKICDDRSHQYANKRVFDIVDRVINARLYGSRDVYLDATNLTPKNLGELIDSVLAHDDYTIYLRTFDLPEEQIREQNQNRQHVVPDHAMDKMFARYKGLDLTPWTNNPRIKIVNESELLFDLAHSE